MRIPTFPLGVFVQVLAASAQDFIVSGGQIFTPGLAVVDAPQPGTPLGGGEQLSSSETKPASDHAVLETLHVAIDVSGNGRLPIPPNIASDSPSQIFNITIFLYSYDTGRNLTVSNGTETFLAASLGPVMLQEPGSTVKHINWKWPDCLVGDGQPNEVRSDRGIYNVGLVSYSLKIGGLTDHYRYLSGRTSDSTGLTTTPFSTCRSQSPTESRTTCCGSPAIRWTTRCCRPRSSTRQRPTALVCCSLRVITGRSTSREQEIRDFPPVREVLEVREVGE
jgi:hypothetical protein